MSQLTLRKIPFEFDGVDFLWNPDNPAFSALANQISFIAPGFERYIVRATKAAEPLISDPDVLEEAVMFRKQEGIHSVAHQLHIKALVARYPGLQQTLDNVIAMYDALYEQRDIKFHLAFSANLEATFTPFFKVIIDHRDKLFAAGDSRVASLLLWHFCEEIEHRSSAMTIYQSVYGDQRFRMKIIPEVIRFNRRLADSIFDGFREHVPGLPEECFGALPFRGVPKRDIAAMFYRLIAAQLPWYDHDRQPLPEWAHTWFEHYERGDDMTNFYGIKPVDDGRGHDRAKLASA